MRQIEAQAIISAGDKTGNVFEAIAGKIRGLRSAMNSLGSVPANAGGIPQMLGRIDSGYKSVTHAVMATAAAHKAMHAVHRVVETYKEYDNIVRYQRAITGMSEADQAPFIKQAIHLGGTTPFNDIKVLHAQLDLMQRGVDKNFIVPMTAVAADYAQAMNADLGDATKTIEGILFSTRKHIEDGNQALKVAKRTVDMAVKLAKIGGLDNEDIRQAYKYGGMSGAMAGLSDESFGAMVALMRRANIRGDEAGVAARAISGALVAPTRPGLAALTAMGIDYSKFTRLPNALNVERFALMMRQTFGKDITPQMGVRLATVFSDREAIGDRGAFTAQTSEILQSLFGTGKDGKIKAQDAHNLAKAIGGFHKLAVESVDTEGLLRAIMQAKPTLALANALFGVKQGSRAMAALGNAEQFADFWQKLHDTPEGFAAKIAAERMAGFSGAVQRSEGALMNLWTALGRANDPFLTAGFDKFGKFVQHVAELDNATLRQITVIGGVTVGLIALQATLSTFRAVQALAAGGLAMAGGAAATPAKAGALARWLPWLGGALSIAMTPDILTKAPTGESWEQVLRRRMPQRATTPSQESQKLEGQIDVNVKVDAAPGLQVSATGTLSRAELHGGTTGSTGPSMPEVGQAP